MYAVTQKDHFGREKSIFESLEYQKLHFLANHLTKCDYHQSEPAPGNPLPAGSCWPGVPEKGVLFLHSVVFVFLFNKALVGQSSWNEWNLVFAFD